MILFKVSASGSSVEISFRVCLLRVRLIKIIRCPEVAVLLRTYFTD